MTSKLKILIGSTSAGRAVGFDLETLITTRLLIQANSGAGKSYLLRGMMEQLFEQVQIIVIDPEGEFGSMREKFPFVLVGPGGEAAADVRTAGLLAERLLELKASAICDIYEMKIGDRHLWVKNFLDALINAPKKLWHPVIVVVDEAHMFCPEKGSGESAAAQAMKDLCSRGRKRGFCAVWATQRLAKVDKDATSLLQNRIIGGTFEDVDIKRAIDLLSIASEDKREFSKQLRMLEPGWFYAFGRAIAKERVLFRGRKVETTHVGPGSAKHAAAPPPAPDKIKDLLPKLADLPKESAERAQTVDDLKKALRAAELQVTQLKRQQPALAVPVIQMSGASEKDLQRAIAEALKPYRAFVQTMKKSKLKLQAVAQGARTVAERTVKELALVEKMLGELEMADPGEYKGPFLTIKDQAPAKPAASSPPQAFTSGSRADAAAVRADRAAANGDASSLPGTSRRLLGILAQWSPQGMRRGQLASFAGIKASTGSFSNRLTDLRVPGYIREEGDLVFATEEGIAALGGDIPDAPATTEEVMAVWKPRLPGTSYRMLEKLVEAAGEPVARAELAESIGVKADTGSFSNRLTDLRTAGLMVDVDKGRVAAKKEALFLEGVYA